MHFPKGESMKVEIFVIDCETASNRVLLSLPAVIGRGNDTDLVIAHPEVSRQHCRLFHFQNTVHIQDLNSLNGTVVAGRKIKNAESPILPEEIFSIGPVQFQIRYRRQDISNSEVSGSSRKSKNGTALSGGSNSASSLSLSAHSASNQSLSLGASSVKMRKRAVK